MAGHGDLTINSSKFGPAAIPPEADAFNENLMKLMAQFPKWFEVGAAKHRQMRIAGQTPLPKPVWLETAKELDVPSRDAGRSVRCRLLQPEQGEPMKAVYMHMHSGGWVLGDEKTNDVLLQDIANKTGTLALSVGYRHAPEDPFPAGPNDCYDVAEWLVDNAQSEFGAPFAFCGGESAGAQLGLLCMLHLLHSPTRQYADFRLQGMVLNYGC